MKKKTVWCYIEGKKHCDVIKWALAANVSIAEAKQILTGNYPNMQVTFEVQ